jgi:hypothetical protein
MGKSLGGATAIHLAAANPGKLCSVVVENTFTSIEDVAHKVSNPFTNRATIDRTPLSLKLDIIFATTMLVYHRL